MPWRFQALFAMPDDRANTKRTHEVSWYPQRNGGIGRRTNMTQLDRITQEAGVMGGKACIRGMRVTVSMIVGQFGAGHTIEEILADYPYLEREDILQALRYAA